MGHASQYEDITQRFFESEPTHLIYGFTEPHDPIEDYLADTVIMNRLKAFRTRIQGIVLTCTVPEENEREVSRLKNFNEKWKKELEDIWGQMNGENASDARRTLLRRSTTFVYIVGASSALVRPVSVSILRRRTSVATWFYPSAAKRLQLTARYHAF